MMETWKDNIMKQWINKLKILQFGKEMKIDKMKERTILKENKWKMKKYEKWKIIDNRNENYLLTR